MKSDRKAAREVLWAIAVPYGNERTLGEIRERIRREELWANQADEPVVRKMHQNIADIYSAELRRKARNVSGAGSEPTE